MKKIITIIGLCALLAHGETYTVTISSYNLGTFFHETNCIVVTPNHEHAWPSCTLIRWVRDGQTNEFHAWAVPVVVKTNQPPFGTVILHNTNQLFTGKVVTNTISIPALNTTNRVDTNAIVKLVESGGVCEVMGHKWEAGCGTVGCLVIHYQEMRHCLVCRKTQSREPGEWK